MISSSSNILNKVKSHLIKIVSILVFIAIMLFYMTNYTSTYEINSTEEVYEKLIFFEFEKNLENSNFSTCKSNCNGIPHGEIEYVDLGSKSAIMFNDENEGWVEIPFNGIEIQNENGISISFWAKVHTHEKRHNMVYNKGPVGWGGSFLKSINGLYEGDLKEFQALWTGNDARQYLNLHCHDGQEIILNKWYFIVHALEKDQSTLKQYINGKEHCSVKSKMPIDFKTQNNLILGRVTGTYQDTSNITIDSFAIYNYELDEEKIEKIFKKELEFHR